MTAYKFVNIIYVAENENKTLQDLNIYNGSKLFLWDGEKVRFVLSNI